MSCAQCWVECWGRGEREDTQPAPALSRAGSDHRKNYHATSQNVFYLSIQHSNDHYYLNKTRDKCSMQQGSCILRNYWQLEAFMSGLMGLQFS